MVKALLCDIDGTLVHSNWLHAEAWQAAFHEIGLDLELETLRRQIGKGGDQLIPVFVPWWKRQAIEQPLKVLRNFIFRSEFLARVEPLPRARDLLVCCKQKGIRVVLASSASEQDLEDYKRLVDLDDVVDAHTSAEDAEHTKPHPDIFTAALDRIGLRAREVIALGDTPYDAESAGLAGISTIGVETGGWTREELMDAGCVAVYRDVADLLDNFETSLLVRAGA